MLPACKYRRGNDGGGGRGRIESRRYCIRAIKVAANESQRKEGCQRKKAAIKGRYRKRVNI